MNNLNFSGGPGVLPEDVLSEVQQAITNVPGVGLSILGISHRSNWFADVIDEAERNIRRLLKLSDSYAVLFLQGGASLQFSMIPMLLLRGSGKTAEYLRTGYWSSKSIPDARLEGNVKLVWDGQDEGFRRLPEASELHCSKDAAYFHYISNETVEGTQFHYVPGLDGVLRVCDQSSDFLSRPIESERFDLIYAHAQKNLGPAGVTVVVLKRELLERVPAGLPAMLDYRNHLNAHSIHNTPPVFAIYVVLLVTRWLLASGGDLDSIAATNAAKASALYQLIDSSEGFFRGYAATENRSLMNVTFTLPTTELEDAFLLEATTLGFSGLNGHRSLGGIRASIYNAMPQESVKLLCEFMTDFLSRHRQ